MFYKGMAMLIAIVWSWRSADLHAQVNGDSDVLWARIAARLRQPGSDTARYFIIDEVRNHCKGDYDCLKRSYDFVLRNLEGRFKHFSGVVVAKEMADLAGENEDIDAQTSATGRLSAIYGFMGNKKMQALYQEQLLSLYEQAGNAEMVIQTKATILEGRVWYLNEAADVLPEMKKILHQAIEAGYTDIANRFRIRIKYVCEEFGFDDELREQVEALEKIPLSDPLRPPEYHIAFHAASGRADLLLKEKKYDQAKNAYLKALGIFQSADKSHHDTWLQIYALFRLAKLEWERRNAAEAKRFLDEAYTIADTTDMHDRAIMYLGMKAEIAEAEKNYADAYRFTREMISRQAILDSLSEGFDMEKYHIQLEREKLESEKTNQALELSLRKNQLRSSMVIGGLAGLLALALLFGLYKQRQGRRRIAAQYDLIERQTEQLKTLDAAKSRFFANVSHELRTPLTLLLGPVDILLKENRLAEKENRLLQMARRNGEQLRQLINEILDLRKLETGNMELRPEPTAPLPFFRNYAAQFESLAERKRIRFLFETSVDPGSTALLDREKCRQILFNLLSNAFKFTPEGGNIGVTLEISRGILHLSVADTGPGIHPDDLPHVFNRFFQTNRPDKPAEGGTGIGLNLCQEYTRLFGGTITADSALGRGSVFRVAFPVKVVQKEALQNAGEDHQVEIVATAYDTGRAPAPGFVAALPETRPQPAADSPKPTILVVEDNPDLQEYIRLILSEKYNVVTAGHGQAALDSLLPDANCQLVLSDLMMPVMDGYQLLERLKSDDVTRHIPVIMLTARAEAQDRLKALRIGVDDYLTKPFDEEELLARIENLLKNQAARQQEVAAEAGEEMPRPVMSLPDREWLETFEAYVQKHFSSDMLSVSALAYEFAMSESSLLRQLKRLVGLTPLQYMQEVRLEEARRLLENRVCNSVTEVASRVGYADARALARSFRARFGKLPSAWLQA